MKKLLGILVLGLLVCTNAFAETLSDQIRKLDNLYKNEFLTKEEFTKAKSILLKIGENKVKLKSNLKKYNQIDLKEIKIRKFKTSNKKQFEKMEMLLGNYRIYTHRPGAIKVRSISDNMQLVVIGDNLKVKYYNDGKKLFNINVDEKNKKLMFNIADVNILHWEGRYVKKHGAYFYQVLAIGGEPFHYYIILKGGKSVGLNIEKFNDKINKAVAKAKIELAIKHGITLEQIELLIERKKQRALQEIEDIIGEEKKKIVEEAAENVLLASINQQLEQQLEETIGQALAREFESAIIEGMENELIALIDEAVAIAVEAGRSEAAIAAGIQAYLAAIASGSSEAEAYATGVEACGSECQ